MERADTDPSSLPPGADAGGTGPDAVGPQTPDYEGDASQNTGSYRGERLGLPERGSGSMATMGRRFAALFIDWMAATLISRALVGTPETVAESFATLAIFALEVTLLTWLWGASFGQRIVGVRVVGRTRRLGLIATTLRTVLICIVIPAVVWDSDGRGLHDRAVDSVVLRA